MNDFFFLFSSLPANIKSLRKITESHYVDQFMGKNIDKEGQKA